MPQTARDIDYKIAFIWQQAHDDAVADAIDDVNRSRQDLQVTWSFALHLARQMRDECAAGRRKAAAATPSTTASVAA